MRCAAFRSYDDYPHHELNKSIDLRLHRDSHCKVNAFAMLWANGLLSNASRALCIGLRFGQEVAALCVSARDAIGIDLAPAPRHVRTSK